MKAAKYLWVALLVIVIDQASKLLVYKYMYIHQEINVIGEWFKLHYLLNPGMAFGIRWENEFGKLALTSFRIVAMIGIAYYLIRMAKRNVHSGFLFCMALILGGAIGNVIDSTFYGVLLNNAPMESPTRWFHGQVIDMLFFPLFRFNWPMWVPGVGGESFLFFSPVFNVADSSIFLGVATILIFQRTFFLISEEVPLGQIQLPDLDVEVHHPEKTDTAETTVSPFETQPSPEAQEEYPTEGNGPIIS